MSVIQSVGQDVVVPLVALWDSFISTIPFLLGGLVVLAFGYLLGEVLEVVLIKILNKLKFNKFIHNLKISKNLEKFNLTHFFGAILKWYIFVIFLVPAAGLAKLGTLTVLLQDFARWVPNFILGVFIILFGWVFADVVASHIEKTKIKSKHNIGMALRALILLFVISIGLEEIGINVALLNQTFLVLLSAVAFGFALALGIGFGLGMKDDAKQTIKAWKKRHK